MAELLARALEEVARDLEHVVAARAQRRHFDRKDAQAVEQVLAKAAVGDGLLEIAVRRRDDAHVDRVRAVVADPLVLALLQHAQQLALQIERDLADLVEEDRAAVGELEAARRDRDARP